MNKLKSLYTDKQIEILKQTQKQDWFMLINHGAKRTGKTILNNDLFLRELMRVRKIADEEGIETASIYTCWCNIRYNPKKRTNRVN